MREGEERGGAIRSDELGWDGKESNNTIRRGMQKKLDASVRQEWKGKGMSSGKWTR